LKRNSAGLIVHACGFFSRTPGKRKEGNSRERGKPSSGVIPALVPPVGDLTGIVPEERCWTSQHDGRDEEMPDVAGRTICGLKGSGQICAGGKSRNDTLAAGGLFPMLREALISVCIRSFML
jgi:hypothetical protein